MRVTTDKIGCTSDQGTRPLSGTGKFTKFLVDSFTGSTHLQSFVPAEGRWRRRHLYWCYFVVELLEFECHRGTSKVKRTTHHPK